MTPSKDPGPAVLVEDLLPAVRLTLNRPEQLNALSTSLLRELIAALRTQGGRPEARVLVIAGAGRAFSPGHDLKEMTGLTAAAEREIFATCAELMAVIQKVPQPVIAQVHGVATAAGCQLVAACDLAVASQDARFATSGIRYGLFCFTPGVAVSRSIGRKRALEMLLTGRFIDAGTAESWGLVNRVVPRDRLEAEVMALAGELAQHSPRALADGKRGFYRQIELDQATAYAEMTEAIAESAAGPDAQEGMRAFAEKRRPVWPAP